LNIKTSPRYNLSANINYWKYSSPSLKL
jgi:hypothetical protein